MTYNHETKAGNRGDVWKHAILMDIFPRTNRFHYSETHGGQGMYNICKSKYVFTIPKYLRPSQKLLDMQIYLGSWVQIAQSGDYYVSVAENNPEYYEMLGNVIDFIKHKSPICTLNHNGYNALYPKDSFIFIDPDYTQEDDWEMAHEYTKKLSKNKEHPWMLWASGDRTHHEENVQSVWVFDKNGKPEFTIMLGNCPKLNLTLLDRLADPKWFNGECTYHIPKSTPEKI